MWENIVGTCKAISKKHSATSSYSPEDALSVFLVCCINKIPSRIFSKADKVLSRAPVRAFRNVYNDPELLKKWTGDYKESGIHAMDVVGGIGIGGKWIATGGRAGAGVVLTALVVKFADKGSTAVCHCAKMGGISRKVVTAAKVFRIAMGINPGMAIALSTVGSFVDVASLIYGAYQIHKKSDSSAGKELIKKKEELQKSREQLKSLETCLSGVINSMKSL